jgi:hypothetical protein
LGEDDHGILVEWRKNPTDKHWIHPGMVRNE